MKILRLISTTALVVWCATRGANACSLTGCHDHGFETRSSFTVTVKHGKVPLSPAFVHISGAGKDFTLSTDVNGRVKVQNLSVGDYWIDVEFLGIGAAYACFHVADHSTHEAKRKLKYQWGEMAPGTRQMAGKLIDSQPGKGGTLIWNLTHRVEVPVTGASLRVQNADTGAAYKTVSDLKGEFAFTSLPSGTYVLHAEGGTAGDRSYDATDQLLNLSPHSSRSSVLLKRREAGAGSCGGTTLELQN